MHSSLNIVYPDKIDKLGFARSLPAPFPKLCISEYSSLNIIQVDGKGFWRKLWIGW